MTPTLALVKTGDGLGDASTLSLYNFTDGWALEENGWEMQVAGEGDTSVIETMTLVARGTSHDDLALKLRNLDSMLRVLTRSRDAVQLYQLWLRAKLNNETGARQALLLSARRGAVPVWSGRTGYAVGGYNYAEAYTLVLERKPWWESNSTPDGGVAGSMAGVSVVGGTANLFTVGGTMPARVADVAFYGDANAANTVAGAINHVWMGVRTTDYGVLANFQSFWSLRKGSFNNDTTGGTSNTDVTAKDGYRAETTFNTVPTLARRVTIKTSQVTSNSGDQRGTFLVLLRAKLNNAGTVRVRLVDGLFGSDQFNVHPRVPISSTSWRFYPLGTVQIPSPSHLLGFTNLLINNYSLGLDAERVPNTAGVTLYMDCFVMIPVDDLLITSDVGTATNYAQSTDFVEMGEWADGKVVGVAMVSSVPNAAGVFTISGGMPTTTGMIVLAADRRDYNILSDTDTVILNTIRRYDTLRGAG